jgi:hypothetical protein
VSWWNFGEGVGDGKGEKVGADTCGDVGCVVMRVCVGVGEFSTNLDMPTIGKKQMNRENEDDALNGKAFDVGDRNMRLCVHRASLSFNSIA